MYVVLGATGHIGSVISEKLLNNGEKVRVVGRDSCRLDRLSKKGAESAVADLADSAALTKALSGARAAFLMIPPNMASTDYRADQESLAESIGAAAEKSALPYAVALSSFGAQAPAGGGPISGLHYFEERLHRVSKLHVLFLRAGYFMENALHSLDLIRTMGIFGTALKPDVKLPMIATRDIGAFAAERLQKLDFSAKSTHELLGQRDVDMSELASIIGRGLNKPDLQYMQFPYAQVEQVFVQMGVPPKTAGQFIEMSEGINSGIIAAEEPRSETNTTPTTIETFIQDIFVPAFKGQAASA